MLSNAVETQEEQQKGLEKLGFEKRVKVDVFDSIIVKKNSIGCNLYIYGLARSYPFQIELQ